MSAHEEMTKREKLLNSVQWYAKSGWKVVPCHGIVNGRCTCSRPSEEAKERGKHPRFEKWTELASSDVDQVTQWWSELPEGNVGVYCKPSGFFVIDIDPRSGGLESWEKFKKDFNLDLPETNISRTGEWKNKNTGEFERGMHIFYRCSNLSPREKLIGNLSRISDEYQGIDIKHNGYVIIAPSQHNSGLNYDWVEGYAPWEFPNMAEAPNELLNLLRSGRSAERARGGRSSNIMGPLDMDAFVEGIDFDKVVSKVDVKKILKNGVTEGDRNNTIYELTCALANMPKFDVQDDIGRMLLETVMIRFNGEKVHPPLSAEELSRTVSGAINFVLENPKIGFYSEETAEWMKKSAESIKSKPRTEDDPLLGVISAPNLPNGNALLAGTHGGTVATSIENGMSILRAGGSSNLDIPADPDAVREEDGGIIGRRTLSDVGNGRRLVDSHGYGIRYTTGIGWLVWAGHYWKPDPENLAMMEVGKRLSSIIASEVKGVEDTTKQTDIQKWANQAKSNSRIKSAIESANSDERIVVDADQWDSNPAMLGVMNGVVDLRTGELLQGRPDLHITRSAPVTYTQGLRSVQWEQFLDFVTNGDREYHDWLQRAAGYTLTGLKKYDVMFLVYGPGGSGKNTFVESIVKCLGTKEYAWPMDTSILASGDGTGSSSDLYHWAELRGRRMVWLDELPDSGYIKENSIKKLTGSSEISARSPGGRPFTFNSQAKLWITTNHRPIITDDAMWRRIRPVPLTRVPENPNPDLKEYLFDPNGGLPAVLSWAVEGAIKVMNSGERDALGWCRVVAEAAEIYRQNEDRIGLFLNEETREDVHATIPIKSLYSTYRNWSDDRGEKPMSQTAFQKKLLERGLQMEGVGSRAFVQGRALLPREVHVPSASDGYVEWGSLTRSSRF